MHLPTFDIQKHVLLMCAISRKFQHANKTCGLLNVTILICVTFESKI